MNTLDIPAVLDTCTMIWLVSGNWDKLSDKAKKIIDKCPRLCVSVISYAEVLCKHEKGEFSFKTSPDLFWNQMISHFDLEVLNVDQGIIDIAFYQLPWIHKDPSDRMILGTAIKFNMMLLTPDEKIHQYKRGKVIW